MIKVPRGIRNKNPLNIRIGNKWVGEVQNPTDTQFEQFISMEYGLRAGFLLIRRYIKHYKRNTITQIIMSWAPPKENHTNKYIEVVCKECNIDRYTILYFEEKDTMCKLVQAMCLVETGVRIDMEIIKTGYDMAVNACKSE